MLERLLENWLDNATERSYQRCFTQMLTGQGFRIVHNTEHTPLEFGKDVIAISPSGQLVGYQLKGQPGTTLKPHQFDKIRGQLEQLATLALSIPGHERKVPDECYLVTNGEIDEAVYYQIQLLNQSLESRGYAPGKIKTITRGTLLDWAKSLGLSLWPSEVEDFGNLVKILNFNGDEMFPAHILDLLLQNTLRLDRTLGGAEVGRRITSAAVMTAVALSPFSRQENYFAELTAWVMFITYSIAACQKNNVSHAQFGRDAVAAAKDGIYDLLGQLCEEATSREMLTEGDPYSEFAFYRPRLLLIYALMAIYWMWSETDSWRRPEHKEAVERIIPDKLPDNWLWGEGAIPHFMTFVWYRSKVTQGTENDETVARVLAALLSNKLEDGESLASPYYNVEQVVQHGFSAKLGTPDPFEGDSFHAHSYFCESLLMCLVRANRKQICKELWPSFTKVNHERVKPEEAWRFGLYRTGDAATNETKVYPNTVNWVELKNDYKEHGAVEVPDALKDDPTLLLLFVNVFPFRATFSAVKYLHRHFDGRGVK